MCEMVRTLPTTTEDLFQLYGMGELKVQRFGALLLDALRPHAEKLRAEHEATAAARGTGSTEVVD